MTKDNNEVFYVRSQSSDHPLFDEVWNQGKQETIDELMLENCVIHDGDTDTKGPEEFKVFFNPRVSSVSHAGR